MRGGKVGEERKEEEGEVGKERKEEEGKVGEEWKEEGIMSGIKKN